MIDSSKKDRRKTNVLEQVSKETKTAIVNDENKYGSPTNLKIVISLLSSSTPILNVYHNQNQTGARNNSQ